MSISERASEWIYSFLTSPATSGFAALKNKEYGTNVRLSLQRHGLSTLHVHEMKAVSSYLLSCIVAVKLIDRDRLTTCRPATSAKKREHSDYIQRLCTILDSIPTAWDALERSSPHATGVSSSAMLSSPRKAHVETEVAQHNQCYSDRCLSLVSDINDIPQTNHPLQFNKKDIEMSQSPSMAIEYWKGIELINLVKYRDGIPHPLMRELQRISQYKGYPSKLRYEQVKIKQEPKHKSDTKEQLLPRNETEVQIVNGLRGMGFQDMQEIVTSMRQVQMENPLAAGDMLIDMIMMHIVQQREEKEESKKMDAARIQSEQSRILQETDYCHEDCIQIVYSVEELLGTEGNICWLFKDSFLLKSPKVKKLFHDLIINKRDENLMVQKLLTIEKKSKKWYGDAIEAFFRFILCEKIEKWYDELALANSTDTTDQTMRVISQRLEEEITYIERELYLVSDESEHMREPRLFKSARDVVTARGLMTNIIHIE